MFVFKNVLVIFFGQFLVVIMLSFSKSVSHKLNWDIVDGFKKIDWLTMSGALMNSCEGARRKLRYVEGFVLFRITGPRGGVILSMGYWLSSRSWTISSTRTLWVRPSQIVIDADGRLKYSQGDAETVSQLGGSWAYRRSWLMKWIKRFK